MTAADPMLLWILGRGGLLGSRLAAAVGQRIPGGRVWDCCVPRFAWQSADLAGQLDAAGASFAGEVRRSGCAWGVVWAAGAGVIGTDERLLAAETDAWRTVLDVLDRHRLGGRQTAPGLVFLASSAGGVYGRCPDDFITEHSAPNPVSAYGVNKLRQEEIFRQWAALHPGVVCRIGRISNLYGPGQNLDKRQGVISQMSRCMIWQRPIHVYVPLDTIRDYLHADDCARQIACSIAAWRNGDAASPEGDVKVFASGRPTTIAQIVGAFVTVAMRRHPRVICAPSVIGLQQPRRLLFRSVVAPDVHGLPHMPLQTGIHQVHQHQLLLYQQGRLLPP
jgi:UDP-glucose 4-epimerase